MHANMLLSEFVEILQRSRLLIEIRNSNSSNDTSDLNKPITSLCFDSRKIESGGLFFAIRGTQSDGHQYLSSVATKATAVIVEDMAAAEKIKDHQIPVLHVSDSRKSLDILASQFYGHPSQRMVMYGVTGTNGKTSTTYMLEWVLNQLKIPTGVIGTIDHHFQDQTWESQMTTPDAISLQNRLSEMKSLGAQAVAMEVSSHGLSQKRADTVHFNVAIFTNLTRDHLDYHKNMSDYFLAKQSLFTDLLAESHKFPVFAVMNVDDEWGRRLQITAKAGLIRFGSMKNSASTCEFRFRITSIAFEKTRFVLSTPFGDFEGEIPMCGEHNVYNAVGVIAAVTALGIAPQTILNTLAKFPGVPGRLQLVPNNKKVAVLVDYAHSPDALENVLKSLNQVRSQMEKAKKSVGKIWTIFGCGGDRDKGKRPLMAKIAQQHSDFVMITSDNPRTEDPEQIIVDIFAGIQADLQGHVYRETDRKLAIKKVIEVAKPGDVILIAGKGHEDYQIIGSQKNFFSDYKTAQEFLG